MKKEIVTDCAPVAVGAYSQAVKSGNLLFISGQIAIDPATGTMETHNISDETHQVLKNIRGILESEGLSFDNIVKTTVYIKDIYEFPIINEIYGQYFNKPYPARACVEVSALPKGVKIEIEAIAEYS